MRTNQSTRTTLICLGLLCATASWGPALAVPASAQPSAMAAAQPVSQPALAPRAQRASFGPERASGAVRQMANWVLAANDNGALPFAIVDKTQAKVFVFHADGRLRGAAAVLLGLAVGDDSVPGIGQRKLADISPVERTTPTGRFMVAMDRNLKGQEMLWVDYDNSISLHPVITSNAKERRAERLATPTPLDNRISYGCINVPADFFKRVVRPAFTGTDGIFYVLPETRSAQQVFASYAAD